MIFYDQICFRTLLALYVASHEWNCCHNSDFSLSARSLYLECSRMKERFTKRDTFCPVLPLLFHRVLCRVTAHGFVRSITDHFETTSI
jgi:hypothetical protein